MTVEQITASLLAAREKLVPPAPRPASSVRALGAAAFAALTALTLAAAVILGPGQKAKEAAKDAAPSTFLGDR